MTAVGMLVLLAGAAAAWLSLPAEQAEDPRQDGSTIAQVRHGRLARATHTQAGGWWE